MIDDTQSDLDRFVDGVAPSWDMASMGDVLEDERVEVEEPISSLNSGKVPPFRDFSLKRESEFRADENWWTYMMQLVKHCRDKDSIRGRQARLTMWECLENFDVVNDFFFILRVFIMTLITQGHVSQRATKMGFLIVMYLFFIWIISLVCYTSRRYMFVHRIEGDDLFLFYPFITIRKIKELGASSPEVLFMFERVSWTYQVVIRVLEDIPQLVCSTIFLTTFGRDLYTYFMISYSALLLSITSYRMSVTYPIVGTISTVFSTAPPIDNPEMSEAAAPTRNFLPLLCINFGIWMFAHIVTLQFVHGLPYLLFLVSATVCASLTVTLLAYWRYLTNQASTPLEQAMLGPMFSRSRSDSLINTALLSMPYQPIVEMAEVREYV